MKGQVFIVNDDPIMGNLLEVRLSEAGYRARYYASGEEAIAAIRSSETASQPGIILTDLSLPGMDGLSLRDRLREDPATARLPVILLPAGPEVNSDFTDQLGDRDDFLPKPFGMETLLERIERLFANAPKAAAEPEPPSPEIPANESSAEPATGEETGLASVLASLNDRGVTGRLEVHELPHKAVIYHLEGRIIHAVYGEATGKKALYRILRDPTGVPELHPQPVDVTPTIHGTLHDLLAEADLEAKALQRLKDSVLDTRLGVDEAALSAADDVSDHAGLAYMIDLVRSHGRMRDVLDASRMIDIHTYKNLIYLLKRGVLTIQGPKPIGIRLVTDSTADLPPDVVRRHDITVLPLTITMDGTRYLDGVEITGAEMVARLRRAKAVPTTDPPGDAEIHQRFSELAGENDVLSIFPSSHLIGTIEAARAARERGLGEYMDIRRRTAGTEIPPRLEMVDSQLFSLGLGLVVAEAAEKIADGWDLDRILDLVARIVPTVRTFFAVSSLDHLRRTGRLGRFSAAVGRLVGRYPILAVRRGEIRMVDRATGAGGARARMAEWIEWSLDDPAVPLRFGVIHAGDADSARALSAELKNRFNCGEILISSVSPSVAAYFGPGAVGVACLPANHAG